MRITAIGLLKSEWTKLWSVRSLWGTLAAAYALLVGLGTYLVIDGRMLGGAEGGDIPFGFTAIYAVGVLVLVVLGVLMAAGEYASGSIRTSMVAAPRRTGVLLAKSAVAVEVTWVLGLLTSVLLYVVVQVAGTVPSARGMSLLDPDMIWGVLGGTLMLPVAVLLGILLGTLTRSPAAGIVLYIGLFQMAPQILPALLPEGVAKVVDYMPLAALDVVRAGGLTAEPYGIGTAAVVLVAWLGGLGALTWRLLKSRDV